MNVLVGFTLAAFNVHRIRSLRVKNRVDQEGRPTAKPKRTRARRCTGNWADVIETSGTPPDT